MTISKVYPNALLPVIESNDLTAVRTANLKSQYPFDKASGDKMLHNGTAVIVDEVNKKIKRPATGKELVGLHMSEERIYESHLGRNSFALNGDVNIPRVAKLFKGDVFETNAVVITTGKNVADATAAVAHTDGYWLLLTATELGTTEGKYDLTTYEVVLLPTEEVMLPNETMGIRFVVDKAGA